MNEALEIAADLASQQWGLVTSARARSLGVAAFQMSRLVDRGAFVRIRHGVYASSVVPWDSLQDVRAHWLALHPETMAVDRTLNGIAIDVVSHDTAAEVYGMGDFVNERTTFTSPQRRQTKQSEVRFVQDELLPKDIQNVNGLPVTTVVRTILDLVKEGHEPGHLRDAINDVVNGGLVTKSELAAGLAPAAKKLGASENTTQAMKSYLDENIAGEDSDDERVEKTVADALAPMKRELQELRNTILLNQRLKGQSGDELTIYSSPVDLRLDPTAEGSLASNGVENSRDENRRA